MPTAFERMHAALHNDPNLSVPVSFEPGPDNLVQVAVEVRGVWSSGEDGGDLGGLAILTSERKLKIQASALAAIEEGDLFTVDGKTYPANEVRRMPPRETVWLVSLGPEQP